MKTKPKIIVGVVAAVAVVAAIVIVTTILLKDNSKKNKSADNGSKGSKNVSASVDLEEAALQKNGKIIPINVQNDYMSYAKQEELAQIECHQDGIYAVTADGKFYFVGYGVYSFEDTKTVFDTGVSSAKYLTGYTSYIDVNGAAYRSGPGVDGSKAVRGFLKVQDDITDMKAFLQFSVYLTKDGRVLVNNVADHQGNLKRSGATEEMNYEEVATNVWEVFLKTGSSDDNYGYLTNDHKLYSMYNGEWVLDLENCMDVSDDGNFVLLDTGVLQYRQLNTSKNTRKFTDVAENVTMLSKKGDWFISDGEYYAISSANTGSKNGKVKMSLECKKLLWARASSSASHAIYLTKDGKICCERVVKDDSSKNFIESYENNADCLDKLLDFYKVSQNPKKW